MKRKPTPEQKAKAEERREALRQLWAKVAEMTEEQRAQFAEKIGMIVTCEGHTLTPNNTILLAYQADNVTIVGGFQQWKKQGRQVRKGEKSMGIWIPSKPKTENANSNAAPAWMENATPESGENKPSFFIFGSVFDISQTEPITKDAQ